MARRAAIILLLALCSACVGLERPMVEKHYYALETARGGDVASGGNAECLLLVRRLGVSPRISGRELVYRMAPGSWTADYYNQFFVTPADMLSQDLRAWLGASGVCAGVVDPGSLAPTDLILEGNVSALHGDFSVKPAQAVAQMQFMLLRDAGGERRVLLTRDYARTAPLADNSPQELVRALREAVSGVYAALEADLRPVLAAQAAARPGSAPRK